MNPIRSSRWCVAIRRKIPGVAVFFALGLAQAEDLPTELPPPPEAEQMPAIEGENLGAELPPPPTLMDEPPAMTAEAPQSNPDALLPDASLEELPPPPEETAGVEENFPPLPGDELPPPAELSDGTPLAPSNAPATFASGAEITDLGVEERLKAKELVLWLYFGPSYGKLTTQGSYSLNTQADSSTGGMGYNAGIGAMVTSRLQLALDFFGTPRTRMTTVDHAMLGLGPRFGAFYAMALFGAQSGQDLTPVTGSIKVKTFSYGVKLGFDLILGHGKDSRVSYGIAPEFFYVTPQNEDGYQSIGGAVSFRLYGYENAF